MRLGVVRRAGRNVATALLDGSARPLVPPMDSLDPLFRPDGFTPPRAPPSESLGPAADATWALPLRRPSKILCIGLNYLDHCREQGIEPPKEPVVFAKFPSSLIGPGEAIEWPTGLTQKVDHEAELAFVVGKKARNVSKAHAIDHVAGYLCANDVTARELQKSDGQWIRAKALDSFCPIGPFLVTADEVPDPQALRISCRVNGVVKQDSNTKNLIFGVPELVAFLSRAFTLFPGDLVLTGTPPGVGVFRKPPEYLHDGDVVEVEIEGLGTLSNPCRPVHEGRATRAPARKGPKGAGSE